jgi:hypothetical protein
MLAAAAAMFALSWLPLYVIRMYLLFGPSLVGRSRYIVFRYVWPIAQWIGSANSCANPFIYCYFSEQFRHGIVGMLSAWTRRLSCFRSTASRASRGAVMPTGSSQQRPATKHYGLATQGAAAETADETVDEVVQQKSTTTPEDGCGGGTDTPVSTRLVDLTPVS